MPKVGHATVQSNNIMGKTNAVIVAVLPDAARIYSLNGFAIRNVHQRVFLSFLSAG